MEPERLDLLRFLKDELSELLMRFPRTFAALRRAREGGTARALDVALRWRADGRTFESFARDEVRETVHEERVRALLDWELALVRVAARGPRRALPGRWRAGGELVLARFDMPALAEALARDESLPPPAQDIVPFAVAVAPVGPGGLPRVRTLRLGGGAAQLARALEAADPSVRARAERALDSQWSAKNPQSRSQPAQPAQSPQSPVQALVDAGVLVPPKTDGATAPALSTPLPDTR